jgi:hypothetical protein
MNQAQRDADLEREIDAVYERMVSASTEDESKALFAQMAQLIHRRSPHQVQKMELERRLSIRQARAAR